MTTPINSGGYLDYASPPPAREADRRRMFLYLLPGAICIAAAIGSWLIEATFDGDSRNFFGVMCVLVTAPLGLGYGIFAIREACRPKGVRALRWALYWNAVIAFGPWLMLWSIVRFGLLKHL